MAGGVALNCVANSPPGRARPVRRGLGAAGRGRRRHGARRGAARGRDELGDDVRPMATAALGRGWSDAELAAVLAEAPASPYERPADIADAVAEVIAGRRRRRLVPGAQRVRAAGARPPQPAGQPAQPGQPRAASTTSRAASSSGRSRRWCWPSGRAEIFEGPLPSPYMLFTHRVRPEWAARIPAVVHVDGTARIQTVDRGRRAAGGADARRRSSARTGRARRRQHEPQHRRAPDGRRPARRARVLRLRAGRRARHRPVPGPPDAS